MAIPHTRTPSCEVACAQGERLGCPAYAQILGERVDASRGIFDLAICRSCTEDPTHHNQTLIEASQHDLCARHPMPECLAHPFDEPNRSDGFVACTSLVVDCFDGERRPIQPKPGSQNRRLPFKASSIICSFVIWSAPAMTSHRTHKNPPMHLITLQGNWATRRAGDFGFLGLGLVKGKTASTAKRQACFHTEKISWRHLAGAFWLSSATFELHRW